MKSANFTLIGDVGEHSLRDVALRLEEFRAVLGRLLPTARVSTSVPTVVIVFASRKSYESFEPVYRGKPSAVGGYFLPGDDVNYVTLMLEPSDDAFRIIFHEFVHLFVRNAISSIPLWVNEGLAEFYSTFAVTGNGQGAYVGRVVPKHVRLLRDRFIPLKDLLAVDSSSPLYNERDRASVFYAESWALVHFFLIERSEGRAQVGQYVTAMSKGETADRAFREAFQTEPAAVEDELRRYIQRSIYRSFEYSFSARLQVDQRAEGRTLSAAEADGWLGDLLLHMARLEEADVRLERALSLDPSISRVQASLGMLRLRQSRVSEAWPYFERAATLDPDNFLTQYAYGLALLRSRVEHAPFTPSGDDPLERARAALGKAVGLNPESTDALSWLGYADLLAGTHLDEARTALTWAVKLAPGRQDYVFRLAEICVKQQDIAEARRLLAALTARTADPEMASAVRSLSEIVAKHSEPVPVFRTPHADEQRAFGRLVRLDCQATRSVLYVETEARSLRVSARSLADIEFVTHRNDRQGLIACGPREPPEAVYVTWRPSPTDATAPDVDGEAVAVEFVPKGYVPKS